MDSDEFELKQKELQLKRDEFEHRKTAESHSTSTQFTPRAMAIIALSTSVITAIFSGFWNRTIESDKAKRELELKEREQRFQIVLKATENRTPEDAAKNLLFFVDIGYLPDDSGKIERKARAQDVPVITTAFGSDNPLLERIEENAASVPTAQGVVVSKHIVYRDGKPVSPVETPNVGVLNEPRIIVIHSTMTPSLESVVKWFTQNRGASAHVIIGRDGKTVQMAPLDRGTFHVGNAEWQGLRRLNQYSIGIELVNRGVLKTCRYLKQNGTPFEIHRPVML